MLGLLSKTNNCYCFITWENKNLVASFIGDFIAVTTAHCHFSRLQRKLINLQQHTG